MLPEEQDADLEAALDSKMDQIYDQPPTQAEEEEVSQEEDVSADVEAEPESEKEEVEEEKEESKEEAEDEPEDPDKEGVDSELTLSQIAAIFDTDENNFALDENGKVVFRTKVDGVEGTANVASAIKSHQLEGHLNKQNMEVVETRKALQAEREQFQQEQNQKSQQLDNALQLAFNELNRDYQSINWESLKITDPNQYLLLKQEYQERQNGLQHNYQQLMNEREQEQQKFHAERTEKLSAETAKIRSLIPGWDSDDAYKSGTAEVRQSLLDHGFNDQEIQNISLGVSVPPEVATRIVVLANKAAQFDKLQKSQSAVIKKIRSAPKVVSAGTVEKQSAKTTLKNAVNQVKKTGEISDEYLEKKLGLL